MTNFNTPIRTDSPSSPESHSEELEMANFVGVLDILVQMDLAINGYSDQRTDNSETQGEKA